MTPESPVPVGTRQPGRRMPRTMAVAIVGLSVIGYLATAYSGFDSSIVGGAAFFVLFAALAAAYQADHNAAKRRRTHSPR